MKKSRYNYVCQASNGIILFNTFTSSILLLTKMEYDYLRNEDFSNMPNQLYNALSENGFLINDDIDERAIVTFNRTKNIFNSECATFRILTTTACNARCFYCYEEGTDIKTMDVSIADNVIKFIKDKTKKVVKINIKWFGGEPLVNYKLISYITVKLDEYAKIGYFMISNGMLFDDKMIKEAVTLWKLKSIQITLDGTKKVYESRKAYISKENTFEKIIDNINLLLSNGIRVNLRLNYDDKNLTDIKKLIKYLGKKFRGNQYLECYPYPLFHMSRNDIRFNIELLNLTKMLIEEKISSGNNLFNFKSRNSGCFATALNNFVIMPDGNLVKCTQCMEEKDFIGSVLDRNNIVSKNYFKWCNYELDSECINCLFLPLCQGGCIAESLKKSSNKCIIQVGIIDEILKEYVNMSDTIEV